MAVASNVVNYRLGQSPFKQKRVDLQKLKDCSERDNFAENITTKISHNKPSGQVEQDWNETKTLLCDAIEETVGFKWKTMSKRKQVNNMVE